MAKLSRRIKIVLLLIVGLVAAKTIFFRAPSEDQMIAHFRQHKAEFEQLRAMLLEDKQIMMIGSDWLRSRDWDLPDNSEEIGVSRQRLADYHALMNTLDVAPIGGDDDYVQFNRFGGGFTDATWGIGYAWSRKPPETIVKSAYWHKPIMRGRRVHSHIEGNWYIFQRR